MANFENMTRDLIYLDNNATTSLDPEVLDAMRPYLQGLSGNASSQHSIGRHARRGIDIARRQIADGLHSDPRFILFVSGATEANNLAILGAKIRPESTILTSPSEHPSVLEPVEQMRKRGHVTKGASLDHAGRILVPSAGEWNDVALAAVQLANGETGTVQDLPTIARALPTDCWLHCDAVQAVGKIAVDFPSLSASSLSVSAHKIHGPQGIGALIHRDENPFRPLLFGGHQQMGMRPGTEPVAAIVGLGKAVELATQRLEERRTQLQRLRNALEQGLLACVDDIVVNGIADHRVPNTTNISFLGAKAEALVMALDLAGVCCSAGTACASGSMEPSAVLRAMGFAGDRLESAVRFSVSRFTTDEEIHQAVRRIADVVSRVRRSVQSRS
ncbi:MAG: cysteine desulfurase family protein [Planctomycetota bacterium]